MDMQKIGGFLKTLRKEKGLTQEQLAEVLGVAGRTVSRWETAVNLPDLSILIQLSEFYNVDIKEILDGEREDNRMDKDLKRTLEKVVDYGEIEKQQIMRIGKIAFSITFFVCATAILAQLFLFDDWRYVFGETLTLLVGGIAALILTARNGLWDQASRHKRTLRNDVVLSLALSAIFTAVFALITHPLTGDPRRKMIFTASFFVVIALTALAALRAFALWSQRSKGRIHHE